MLQSIHIRLLHRGVMIPGNDEKVLIKVFINHFAKQEMNTIGLSSPSCIIIPYPKVIRDWYGVPQITSPHTKSGTHTQTHTNPYPRTHTYLFQLLQRVLSITVHLSNKHSRPNVPVVNYTTRKENFVETFYDKSPTDFDFTYEHGRHVNQNLGR